MGRRIEIREYTLLKYEYCAASFHTSPFAHTHTLHTHTLTHTRLTERPLFMTKKKGKKNRNRISVLFTTPPKIKQKPKSQIIHQLYSFMHSNRQ